MSKKRIVIVSRYPLFDQGLSSALEQQPDVEIVGVYRDPQLAAAEVQGRRPEVVVAIAGAEAVRGEAFQALKEASACFIQISPTDGSMQIYQRQRVDRATLDDLMAAIQVATEELSLREVEGYQEAPGGPVGGWPPRPTAPNQRGGGMRHYVIVGVLVTIGTIAMALVLRGIGLFPPQASTASTLVDRLLDLQIYVIAFLFSLIVAFMLYSVIAFRRREGDDSDGAYLPGDYRLEAIWTIIPLAVVIIFATLGSSYLRRVTAPQPDELVVEVTGAQFSWTFDYPVQQIRSSELVLPVNRPVLFRLTAVDVIHSFWVPEFRIKQDAVPDRITTLRLTPTRVGEYKVRCAEMCGYAHSYMLAPVRVVEQADFDAWLAGRQASAGAEPASLAEQGAQLAQEQGCLACHSIDGSEAVGPTWRGLYGRDVPLSDGAVVTADDAYLHESIVTPGAKLVASFPDVMPKTYDEALSDEQVNALVEYIKTLGE